MKRLIIIAIVFACFFNGIAAADSEKSEAKKAEEQVEKPSPMILIVFAVNQVAAIRPESLANYIAIPLYEADYPLVENDSDFKECISIARENKDTGLVYFKPSNDKDITYVVYLRKDRVVGYTVTPDSGKRIKVRRAPPFGWEKLYYVDAELKNDNGQPIPAYQIASGGPDK